MTARFTAEPPLFASAPASPRFRAADLAPASAAPSIRTRPYTATGAASARTSYTRVDQMGDDELLYDHDEHPQDDLADDSCAPAQQPDDAPPAPAPPAPPQTHITFLLISGRRRTMAFDPDTTVGRVKELVWNAWPADWQDERPPSPVHLRILHLGKILQDDDTLTGLSFPSAAPPTVVHLAVRTLAPPTDAPKKQRDPDAAPGCCGGCVVC